jgi:KDO2-lipid IV(A) lauroyltransferase
MYPIVYSLFYLISLLPLRVLYILSDGIYGILYYIIGYRKNVVRQNLLIAFPEKSDLDRKKIEKAFYHQFVDTFIEAIKLISMSEKEFSRRFSIDIEVLNNLYATGQNVQLVAGHFFSWEFANLGIAKQSAYPFIGVYMPLSNKVIDKIMYKMRSRFGTILISTSEFRNNFPKYASGRYALALVADQNPGRLDRAFWAKFFTKPAPFVLGPEKGARASNAAVVFVDFFPVKRGYYKAELELVTTAPNYYKEGALTKLLIEKIEGAIRKRPSNYLWSHRRWKWTEEAEKYAHLMV